MPRKENTRAEIEYQVQDVIPFLSRHYGFPKIEDKKNVRMLSVPVKMGAATKKPDAVYYFNGYPVFVLECKKPRQRDDDTLGQAFSYIRNFPNYNPEWSRDGFKPRFFATYINKELFFYQVIYKTIKGSTVDEAKPISQLSFNEVLKNCRLLKSEKTKLINADEFNHFLYELTEIFDVRSRKIISRDTIEIISSLIKNYLAYKENFILHEPAYHKLNKYPQRQRRLLDLLSNYNLFKSSGAEIAKEFRSFIIRAFQGTEYNQYLTPLPIISFMLDITGKIRPSEKVFDFECGSGGFLAEAASRGKLLMSKIKGIDIDELPCLIAKTYLALFFKIKGNKINSIPIIYSNGLFYYGKNWDIVIGNPAGSDVYKHGNLDKILVHGIKNIKEDEHKFSEYELSVQQAIRSTKPDGRICLIFPEGLLSNSSAKYIRNQIHTNCNVKAIIGLPRGIFEVGTEVSDARKGSVKHGQKMSILLLQKRRVPLNSKSKNNIFIASLKNVNVNLIDNELKIISNHFLTKWK